MKIWRRGDRDRSPAGGSRVGWINLRHEGERCFHHVGEKEANLDAVG